ncbi:ubiquitin-conjugating enzyme E2 T isoform X1 [Pteropus medius]|uniref:ubiquitin-conjugating enzyme E2 T isoform X1 n=1 Tax=Pteropus vampyrus TaxID=132908 RepID=UPI00196A8C04|nr:ubiquitin-conjugating enzyme E2 T isoform X1 [Pteropus giganteus]XP_039739523.1 ubiquitin-conjugating enzyme E2 T isoform X1 [Pteropus giganteus]
MQRASRLKRELQLLATEPPPGITCWQDTHRDDLRAQILGGADTPYEKGVFKLEVVIPERYPFEPPQIRFLTPIYHPNIDSAGRICLDILKLPPKGAWRPSLSIATVLTSIQLLMSEPNPDDPLVADVSSEFKYNKPVFLRNARQWTEKHARPSREVRCSCGPDLAAAAAADPDVRKCLPGLPDGFHTPEWLIHVLQLRPSDYSAKQPSSSPSRFPHICHLSTALEGAGSSWSIRFVFLGVDG